MPQSDATSRAAAPIALTEVFQRVRSASAELADLDTAIARCVARLNATLQRFAVARVITLLPREFDADGPLRSALVFGRRAGRWEMLIERGSFDRDGRFNRRACVPVRLAARGVRAELLRGGYARALVERVVERAARRSAAS